jgi:pimeloyl-ACP methyl ester carboxylesterase
MQLSPADREELTAAVAALGKEIDSLRGVLKSKPALLDLLPDVQIYHNAVRYALTYNEIFKPAEIPVARKLVQDGLTRAAELRAGKPSWTSATGLVARGYVSRIDGSVQPYGLVVPVSYRPGTPYRHRLDIWFHGRGETLSEVNFIDGRQKSAGEFAPKDTFVLHPYGRYCNANHFAGEVDTFEALDHVKKHYSIDDNRLVVRGFSMGGAACWHFAVHHAGMWAAAAPGAGFSETPDFLRVFQNETLKPAEYEKKLWHLYDCTDYALNLYQCPTVAYSGDKDKQKQAADIMARALSAEGLTLTHITGPDTAHKYHPQAKEEINRRIDSIAARGRNPVPRKILFTTWTLRYHRMLWLTVDALQQHWEKCRVEAEIVDATTVKLTTANVTALTLSMPAGLCPLENALVTPDVIIDGQRIAADPVMSDRSWTTTFHRTGPRWAKGPPPDEGLHKRHGLQGPIDDAFMDSFLMVQPTGKVLNDKVGQWASAEMAHAREQWRQQFRGAARFKKDIEVTDADIAAHNLVLWGDPRSNHLLAKIADRLPIRWDAGGVCVGAKTYMANHHVPVLIYPNPLNPKKYVVLNSGFTFREYDYLNNARQVPKLPDYAIVDVNSPVTSRAPGAVVDAGFFSERWTLK